jgi:hypothetical protein
VASSAEIGSPVKIISSATGAHRRGRRCVPPLPGSRPNLTSGRPNLAFGEARRRWQAMASSRPPPSAYPLMAAITGLVMFSICEKTR